MRERCVAALSNARGRLSIEVSRTSEARVRLKDEKQVSRVFPLPSRFVVRSFPFPIGCGTTRTPRTTVSAAFLACHVFPEFPEEPF